MRRKILEYYAVFNKKQIGEITACSNKKIMITWLP